MGDGINCWSTFLKQQVSWRRTQQRRGAALHRQHVVAHSCPADLGLLPFCLTGTETSQVLFLKALNRHLVVKVPSTSSCPGQTASAGENQKVAGAPGNTRAVALPGLSPRAAVPACFVQELLCSSAAACRCWCMSTGSFWSRCSTCWVLFLTFSANLEGFLCGQAQVLLYQIFVIVYYLLLYEIIWH